MQSSTSCSSPASSLVPHPLQNSYVLGWLGKIVLFRHRDRKSLPHLYNHAGIHLFKMKMQHYQSESYSQLSNFLQSIKLLPLLPNNVFSYSSAPIKIYTSRSTSRWKSCLLWETITLKQSNAHEQHIWELLIEPSTVPSWMQNYFVWGFKGEKLAKEAYLELPFWVYPSSSLRLWRGNG